MFNCLLFNRLIDSGLWNAGRETTICRQRRDLVTFRAKEKKNEKWQIFVSKRDKVAFISPATADQFEAPCSP